MKPLKWGIMAAGRIAVSFAKAVNRSENSVFYAVASRDKDRARNFAETYGASVYYGDYRLLCEDENVDVIYIASPMAQHYEQVKMCLEHGKNVLCEKTVTLNAAQFDELIALAREKDLFLMEAMWTKFIPAFLKAKEWVADGRIGNIKAINAVLSNLCPFNAEDRLFNKTLGGGALLDVGVYPITFACDFLGYEPQKIICSGHIGKSGVDLDDSIVMLYDGAYADLHCGFEMESSNSAYIVGEKGRIRFSEWFFCTDTVWLYDDNGALLEKFCSPHLENGYEYEVFEVEKCLAAGLKQSEVNPLCATASVMRILDKCRADIGLAFDNE